MKREFACSGPWRSVTVEFVCTVRVSRAPWHGSRGQAGWISSLRDFSIAQPPAQAHCSEGEGRGLDAGKAAEMLFKFCSCVLLYSLHWLATVVF